MQIEEGKYYRTRGAGAKVGPMYRSGGGWTAPNSGLRYWSDGRVDLQFDHSFDLVAEWVDGYASPVRTVTRKEIVLGEYGRVRVFNVFAGKKVGVRLIPLENSGNIADLDANELRHAAAIFTQLADALEEGK